MTVTFDTSVLLGYYQSRPGGSAAASARTAAKVPTAPWSASAATKPASLGDLAATALRGGRFIDVTAAKVDVAGAPADYRDLFALHQGLSELQGLATRAQDPATPAALRSQLSARYKAGLAEVSAFLDSRPFQKVVIANGSLAATATSGASVKREAATYTTAALGSGSVDAEIPALAGDLAFSGDFELSKTHSVHVDFDLSGMSEPRTLPNVVKYLNATLASAGVASRFAVQRTPGAPQTITAGGRTTTVGAAPDTFSLRLDGVASEAVAFSAPAAAPAVYLAQAVGSGASVVDGLVKLDPAGAAASRTFDRALPNGLTHVRASAAGPDGSLYVLADGAGSVAGQTIKGASDVVLLRYDSAGALGYARTLGAAAEADGLALAVSPDGSRVAVAGSVTGGLGDDGGVDPTVTDSFVTVYGSDGVEQWTRRRGAAAQDAATSVAFGADGSVYAAGRTASALPGAAALGGQDGYLQGFSAAGAPTFATLFGSAGADRAVGVATAPDGSVITAGVEDGHAVLRRYAPPFSAGMQASAVRDLGELGGELGGALGGDLGGGRLLGVSVDADGTIRVAGSTGADLQLAGATKPAGQAVFAAAFAPDLAPAATDRAAWWSPGSDATATAMSVSGGRVYVAGTTAAAATDGSADPGSRGFLVALDPGAPDATPWSQSFAGQGGHDAPAALAVDAAGGSALDRLGLPRGAVAYADATDLASATALRPGDGFKVAVDGSAARTVTVEAGDTLTDLALKINRATGFAAAATVSNVGGFSRLVIAPANARTTLSLTAGPPGTDALKALGLTEGVLRTPPAAKGAPDLAYALNLGGGGDLDSVAAAKTATAKTSAAVTFVRQAYAELSAVAAKTAKPGKTGGTVPAYLTARIGDYQLALSRLTGGG